MSVVMDITVRSIPTTVLFLRLLVCFGLPTGALLAWGSGVDAASAVDFLLRLLAWGGFVGLFFALIVCALQPRVPNSGLGASIDVRQVAAIVVAGPPHNAVAAIRDALPALGSREVAFRGDEYPILTARTSARFRSWGEELSFSCFPRHDGRIEVHVESRPRLRTSMVDSGKNLANVEAFLRTVDRFRPIEASGS